MFAYLVRDIVTGQFYRRDGKLWDGKSKVQVPKIHSTKGHATNSLLTHEYRDAEVVKFLLTEISDS